MWLTTDEFNFVPAFFNSEVIINGATTTFPCQIVNMAKYDSMVAIISLYTPSAAILYAGCYDAATPTCAGAGMATDTTGSAYGIPNTYYRYSVASATTPVQLNASSDVLSARAAFTSTGVTLTTATTSCLNYYVEIKSSDLPDGYPYVAIAISTSATACTGACVNYVMKPKYLSDTMSRAIS